MDRRTVTKVLRHTKPDAHERGQPRWRLRTILDSLETNAASSARHRDNNDLDDELNRLYQEFDATYDSIKALPTLTARRSATLKLTTLIARTYRLFRQRNALDGEDSVFTNLKADKLLFLIARGFEKPCAWTLDEARANLYASDDDAA